MRILRSVCLAILLLALLVTTALAETENVTLFSGEQVQIEQVGFRTTITLPSGVSVTRTEQGNSTSWSAAPTVSNADIEKAQRAYDLWASNRPRTEERTGPVLFALFAIAVGLFNLLAPQMAWYLAGGWKFRDAEPSDLAISLHRVGGGIGVVIGVGLLIFG